VRLVNADFTIHHGRQNAAPPAALLQRVRDLFAPIAVSGVQPLQARLQPVDLHRGDSKTPPRGRLVNVVHRRFILRRDSYLVSHAQAAKEREVCAVPLYCMHSGGGGDAIASCMKREA
jgi:hypothetical protein